MDTVISEAKDKGYELLLHSDADMYIRQPLDNLFLIMKNHDISMLLRNRDSHRLKVFGGLLGFNLNGNLEPFVENWMSEIDKVAFKDRWMGFGQSVIWFALEKTKNINIADLNKIDGAPRFSKTFEQEHEIWMGNSKVLKPVKVTSLPLCWEDYKKGVPRIKMEKATFSEKSKNKFYSIYRKFRKIIKKNIGI
jgi:hypothetical protein